MIKKNSPEKAALLFSGHNQRSVVALCRYFSSIRQPFVIVSSSQTDPIYKTDYKSSVIFEREDSSLSVSLFEKISQISQKELAYCPTSEYLNNFFLEHAELLSDLNFFSCMPSKKIYADVTGKKSSQLIFNHCDDISIIEELPIKEATIPFVLKPFKNIVDGKVLYPFIIQTEKESREILNSVPHNLYFAQKYINGQSYYCCGYLSQNGKYSLYWQENLLQQPNGKSIVFAKSCKNPGIKEQQMIEALKRTGFHGPFMIEFLKEKNSFHFIEINPRFWGPLQLGVDFNSRFINLFAADQFGQEIHSVHKNEEKDKYYAWYFGAKNQELKEYPACEGINNVEDLMWANDVYNRQDTIRLSHQY